MQGAENRVCCTVKGLGFFLPVPRVCLDFSMFLRTKSLENVQVETSNGIPFP